MMATVGVRYLVVFLLLLAVMILGAVLYSRLLALLRDRHSEAWKTLGSPTLVANNTLRNSLAMWRFVFLGQHRRLVDKEVDGLAGWLRWLGYGALVLWLFLVSFRIFSIK